MKHTTLLFLVAAVASTHTADAQNNVCVPPASGVPTRFGPPRWIDWPNSNVSAVDTHLDDPRWLGSTGQTFERGSAKAPLQMRAVYANQAGQEYVYLSFLIDVEGFDTRPGHESVARRRDVWLGFRRPTQTGNEKGYMFQFHLSGQANGGANGIVTPSPCDVAGNCDDDTTDYWRVYIDHGTDATEDCSDTPTVGNQYDQTPAASAAWLLDTTNNGAVRYWKVSTGDPSPLLQNRWAVQVRIPMIAALGEAQSPLAQGMEINSTFFYEATANLDSQTPDGAPPEPGIDRGSFARIGWFPASLPNFSVCPRSDNVIHPEGTDPLAMLTTSQPVLPALPCDSGITIDSSHVGSVFNASYPDPTTPAFQTFFPGRVFGIRDTTTPNHVIAMPFNTGATTITAPLQARFRLAGWGSQYGTDPNDHGVWKDIRGAQNGVCMSPFQGTSGTCTPSDLGAKSFGLITFDWTIGGDPTIGSSEYCQFGQEPPAATGDHCVAASCTCLDGSCGMGQGVQASKSGGGNWPCVKKISPGDECVLVELNAPNGGASFVHQSTWNNMSFGAMSTLTREALIDARQLPTRPGQKYQDIYFIAMPRNMPATLPPGTSTVDLTRRAALAAADAIARPYKEDVQAMPGGRKEAIHGYAKQGRHWMPPFGTASYGGLEYGGLGQGTPDDVLAQQIADARVIMPYDDALRVENLLRVAQDTGAGGQNAHQTLVSDTYSTVGSAQTAEIVPTLEIYPFYKPYNTGREYTPMTSFALFLSHEQTLAGIHYEIDGATKVGANIYHLRIPVGYAKRIQIRAQAIEPPEAVQGPGNPNWPNSGGGLCSCNKKDKGLLSGLTGAGPGVIAGVLVVRRRKKQKKAKA